MRELQQPKLDVEDLQRRLRGFIESHERQFSDLSARHSQLLEMSGMAAAVNHYQSRRYDVTPDGLRNGSFKVNLFSNGRPWNFSWWKLRREGRTFELRTNLKVSGAYGLDDATYVVGCSRCCRRRFCPPVNRGRESALADLWLVTFLEVKALVVYPMLIAQFIGIVHELKPDFLGHDVEPQFKRDGHFPPSLVSLGYLQGICAGICKSLPDRRFNMAVIPNFDKTGLSRRLGRR